MGCSSKFSDLCVQRPSLVMLITFLGSMLLTALAMTNFPALAQGGMEASDSLVQKRVTAANMLTVKKANDTVRTSYLYYDAAAGNALDEENLRKVCKFESAMFHHAAYRTLCTTELATGNCAAMPSLVTLLFTQDNSDADGNTCTPLSLGVVSLGSQRCMTTCVLKPDWQFHLERLANPSLAANESVQVYNMYKQYGAAFVGNDISTDGSTVPHSRYVRSKVTTEDYQETVKKVLDPVAKTEGLDSSSKLRVYYQDDGAFLNVLIQDMMLAAASIIIVFLYMWFNTQSLFLTICGLFEIIISFPIAFFVWGVMLGQEHYTILQMMTLFILLGIGADDIFVLQDAWRQSAAQPRQISGTKLARFEWAYNRASNAMLTTTFTTFMAFVSTALVPVPVIRSMGVFAAVAVLADFLLVITWFAAALMFHDRYFLNKSLVESATALVSCGGAAKTHDIETGKAAGKGESDDASSVPVFHSSKCCCCIPAPCCVVHQPNTGEKNSGSDSSAGGGGSSGELLDPGSLRLVERGFYDLARPLTSHSKPILLFFGILFVTGLAVTATSLKAADSLPDMFPDDHPVMRVSFIARNMFGQNAEDAKRQMRVVWGLDNNDPIRRGGAQILPDENGAMHGDSLRFDPSFASDAGQMKLQTEMVDVCESIPLDRSVSIPANANGQLPKDASGLVVWSSAKANGTAAAADAQGYEVYCVFSHLKQFVLQTLREQGGGAAATEACTSWPCPTGNSLVKALQSAAFLQYLHRQEKAHGPTLFGRAVWYSQAGTGPSSYTVGADDAAYGPYVQAAWATFNTTIPSQQKMPVSRIESWHRAWEEAMGRVAAGGGNAFAVVSGDRNNLYSVMVLVEELLKSSVSGIAISLGLAYFTLIVSTRNLAIATMAIASIIGIMVTVFFTMVVIGWEISIIESICMIVVVGMSVDYTVHLMHSYHESDLPTRFERGRAALTEMGVSVLSGAVTTFFASCPLLGATFLFFVRFGTFIAIITVYSIVWGVFFLMALALTVGPEVDPDTKLLKGEITLSLCRGSGKSAGSALVCDGDSEGEVHGSSDGEAMTEASSVEVRALQTDQKAESADEEQVQQANPNRTQV